MLFISSFQLTRPIGALQRPVNIFPFHSSVKTDKKRGKPHKTYIKVSGKHCLSYCCSICKFSPFNCPSVKFCFKTFFKPYYLQRSIGQTVLLRYNYFLLFLSFVQETEINKIVRIKNNLIKIFQKISFPFHTLSVRIYQLSYFHFYYYKPLHKKKVIQYQNSVIYNFPIIIQHNRPFVLNYLCFNNCTFL